MSRIEFMNELESLLSDIPIVEREEALQYYNDYFEDAGAEHEDIIMKELVSPQRIASIIKANLDDNAVDPDNRGYFTEKGYEDTTYKDEKYEIVGTKAKEAEKSLQEDATNRIGIEQKMSSSSGNYQRYQQQNEQQQNYQQSKQTKSPNVVLIVLLCIFAIPIGLPLIISFFGVVIGIIAAIAGVILGLGISGVTMMGVGVALVITGLIQIGVPFIGLLFCGSGLIVLGLGMLFTLITGLLCKKVLPAMVRGFVNLCRLPFRNRSVTA